MTFRVPSLRQIGLDFTILVDVILRFAVFLFSLAALSLSRNAFTLVYFCDCLCFVLLRFVPDSNFALAWSQSFFLLLLQLAIVLSSLLSFNIDFSLSRTWNWVFVSVVLFFEVIKSVFLSVYVRKTSQISLKIFLSLSDMLSALFLLVLLLIQARVPLGTTFSFNLLRILFSIYYLSVLNNWFVSLLVTVVHG